MVAWCSCLLFAVLVCVGCRVLCGVCKLTRVVVWRALLAMCCVLRVPCWLVSDVTCVVFAVRC